VNYIIGIDDVERKKLFLCEIYAHFGSSMYIYRE